MGRRQSGPNRTPGVDEEGNRESDPVDEPLWGVSDVLGRHRRVAEEVQFLGKGTPNPVSTLPVGRYHPIVSDRIETPPKNLSPRSSTPTTEVLGEDLLLRLTIPPLSCLVNPGPGRIYTGGVRSQRDD